MQEVGKKTGDLVSNNNNNNNNNKLITTIKVFPIPYAPEFYRKEVYNNNNNNSINNNNSNDNNNNNNKFRSDVADMKNSVADRGNAQASCGLLCYYYYYYCFYCYDK